MSSCVDDQEREINVSDVLPEQKINVNSHGLPMISVLLVK